MLRERLNKEKDAELERFKAEKSAEISLASARAAEANERAGKLELDSATQRKLTAEANKRAEEAKLELARFKAPRSFSSEQWASFIKEMSEFKGHHVGIAAVSTTAESALLENQLFTALEEAGVNVERKPEAVQGRIRTALGVVARHTTGNEKGTRFAFAFSKALNEKGITSARLGSLDEGVVDRLEREQGLSRNHPNLEWVLIAVGDKP